VRPKGVTWRALVGDSWTASEPPGSTDASVRRSTAGSCPGGGGWAAGTCRAGERGVSRDAGRGLDGTADGAGGVEGGHQGEGAAGLGQRHGRRGALAQTGQHLGELRPVTAAGVLGADPVPGAGHGGLPLGEDVVVSRCRGHPPVLVPVAVQVGDLDGGVLEVVAQIGLLARGEGAVHHRGDGAVRERHVRHRDVLGLGTACLRPGEGLYPGPVAEQVQHHVHLVDAEPHGGPAALGVPAAAPGHVVVRLVAEPRGVADREQWAAQHSRGGQGLERGLAAAETVLENGREPRRSARGTGDLVELPQGQRGRLLHQHTGTGAQTGEGLVAVETGRCAQVHQVGAGPLQQHVEVVVAGRGPVLGLEGLQPGPVGVRRRHDPRGDRARGGEGGRVVHGDVAGAHDRYPYLFVLHACSVLIGLVGGWRAAHAR
jgi:hypothetical protein